MNNDFSLHQQIFKFVLIELKNVLNEDSETYDYEEYDFDQTYDYDRYDYYHTQDDDDKLYGHTDDWEDYYDSIYG